jgi:hypothetical protein
VGGRGRPPRDLHQPDRQPRRRGRHGPWNKRPRGQGAHPRPRVPLEYYFAKLLKAHGNRVIRFLKPCGAAGRAALASFPVKRHWRDEADPDLIERSAHQLVALAEKFGYGRVVLPRSLREIPRPNDAADGLAIAVSHAFSSRVASLGFEGGKPAT